MKKLLYVLIVFSTLSCSDTPQLKSKTVCNLGETSECTEGPTLGECRRGTMYCWGDYWDSCRGEVTPSVEVCDGLDNDCDGVVDNGVLNSCGYCGDLPEEICDGKDNDCDLSIDEGLSGLDEVCDGKDNDCDDIIDEGLSKRRQCAPDGATGDWIVFDGSECQYGWQECREGAWGECVDFIGPTSEICDGRDNDCNGEVDDLRNLGECGISNSGSCRYGYEICYDSEIICIDSVNPQNETCDGRDNDCDGEVDEDLQRECQTSCESGVEFCFSGEWVGCTARSPSPEICDGIDNDCDQQIDEDIYCDCSYGDVQPCLSFPCGWGVRTCLIDGSWSDCSGEVSQPETCNNHDDNCNDVIDEDLSSPCYDADPNTIGVGICTEGQSICFEGVWSSCMDQQTPEQESCDGIDNDCDGEIDDLQRYFEKVDMIFAIDVSGSMDLYILPLIDGIEEYVVSLQGTDHKFGIVTFGATTNNGEPNLRTQLSEIDLFMESLRSLEIDGGIEPSLDAVMDISSSQNIFNISWRDDATPIVILVTDEQAQTERFTTPEDLSVNTHTCRLPGCNSLTNESWIDGDPLEMFAFVFHPSPWDEIIAAEGVRIFDITRVQEESTLSADLNLLFTEICVTP